MESNFVDYFLAEEKYEKSQFYLKNQLMQEDESKTDFQDYVNDAYLPTTNYIRNIYSITNEKVREIKNENPNLTFNKAKYRFIRDSLSGKTREFVLAKWLYVRLTFNNYDTLGINLFQKIKSQEIPIETVDKALALYQNKQSLLGKPFHQKLKQTALINHENETFSLAEVIEDAKGYVLYFHFWSKHCGQCIRSQPFLKNLNSSLKNKKVKVILLSTDDDWDYIQENYQSFDNHYLLKNGRESQLHKELQVNWSPYDIVLDSKGNVIDLFAKYPSLENNVQLEKQLLSLVEESEITNTL